MPVERLDSPRRRRLALAIAACLAVGAFVLLYRGPGRAIVRGHLGDVAIVALLYFSLAWWTPRRRALRAASVGALAACTELAQLVLPPMRRSLAIDLTVGRTFDPVDLAAYALGLAVAVGLERAWIHPAALPAQDADRMIR